MSAPQVSIRIPDKLLPIFEPRRFKIMYGGRGGAKSHTVAQALPAVGLQRSIRILCAREVQKSIEKSSMQVLKDYIKVLGLEPYYRTTKSGIESRVNDTVFSFTGLLEHTAESIKSFEGADITWVEEAHKVSRNSWNILIPTVLRKDGAEIWATFNPDQEDDYVYDRFVKKTDPDAWVCPINWRDNPWFPAALNDERLKLKAINEDLHDHIWEGKPRTDAGVLFKRPWFKRFRLGEQPAQLRRYMASDYAGGPDPDDPNSEPDWTEHGCAGLDVRGDLWFVDWWSGQEDPDVWIAGWVAMLRRNRPAIAFEEKGVILRSLNGSINKAMREAGVFVHRQGLPSASSKATRALGFAARASAGTVWIPETDWGDRLVNQLCAFTGQAGRTDDMVDVCSLLARGLDMMVNAEKPPEEKRDGPEPFTLAWMQQRDRAADEELERYCT